MKALFKTTVVIWTEYNPEGAVELADLARDATDGPAYCAKQETVCVANPSEDPDWDGTAFFDEDEDKMEALWLQ